MVRGSRLVTLNLVETFAHLQGIHFGPLPIGSFGWPEWVLQLRGNLLLLIIFIIFLVLRANGFIIWLNRHRLEVWVQEHECLAIVSDAEAGSHLLKVAVEFSQVLFGLLTVNLKHQRLGALHIKCRYVKGFSVT
jgi:hypothetical protein